MDCFPKEFLDDVQTSIDRPEWEIEPWCKMCGADTEDQIVIFWKESTWCSLDCAYNCFTENQ